MKRDLDNLVQIFKALSCRRRLELIEALVTHGPTTVSSLSDMTRCSLTSVSQHLAILSRCGFVASRKTGTTVIYRIKTTAFTPRQMMLLWLVIYSFEDKEKDYGLDNLASSLLSGDYRDFLRALGGPF